MLRRAGGAGTRGVSQAAGRVERRLQHIVGRILQTRPHERSLAHSVGLCLRPGEDVNSHPRSVIRRSLPLAIQAGIIDILIDAVMHLGSAGGTETLPSNFFTSG